MERICKKSICSVATFLLIILLAIVSNKTFPEVPGPADTTTFLNHEIPRDGDSITQFNQFGSFGFFLNGIQAFIQTPASNLLTNYSYSNFNGYRAHNNEFNHALNLQFETAPSGNTTLLIAGHYINGILKNPGSLTKKEFDSVPYNAAPRSVSRDEKRITQKGQVEIKYDINFGKTLNQKFEISGNGTIEYFERVTKEFKITTRYIMGLSARYYINSRFWNRNSVFSAGGDLLHQPERKEEYENFGGQRSDNLEQIEVEKTSISTCFISENFEIVKTKLFVLLTGRYKHVIYSVAEETVPSRSDTKPYHAFTPEIALYYQVIPPITLGISWDMNFKNPTDKELESPVPEFLYNQDLKPQTSTTLKAWIAGTLAKKKPALFFKTLQFEAQFFRTNMDNEIVQLEVYGDYYYRNASKTNRFGFALNSKLEIYQDLTFSIAYTFSHFLYKSYIVKYLDDSTGLPVSSDYSGNVEPNVPRNNLNLSLAYQHSIGGKTGIFAKISYLNISGLWVDDANSDKTDAYNLINTMLGFDFKFGHFFFTVSGGVNNIFNQVYVENSNINSADYRFYNAGSPRDFFGSINFGYMF